MNLTQERCSFRYTGTGQAFGRVAFQSQGPVWCDGLGKAFQVFLQGKGPSRIDAWSHSLSAYRFLDSDLGSVAPLLVPVPLHLLKGRL